MPRLNFFSSPLYQIFLSRPFPWHFQTLRLKKKLFPIRDLLLVGLSHLDVQNRTFWHLHFLPPFVSSQRGKRFGVFVSVLWNDNRGGRSVAIPIFNSCHFFAHCCGKTQSDFLLISAAVCKCQKMAKNGFVSEKTHEALAWGLVWKHFLYWLILGNNNVELYRKCSFNHPF